MKHDWLIAFLWKGDENGPVTCPMCGAPAKSRLQMTSLELFNCPKGHKWVAYRTDWTIVSGGLFLKIIEYLTPKR